MGAVKDSANRHRKRLAAARALIESRAGSLTIELERLIRATMGTSATVNPADAFEVFPCTVFS